MNCLLSKELCGVHLDHALVNYFLIIFIYLFNKKTKYFDLLYAFIHTCTQLCIGSKYFLFRSTMVWKLLNSVRYFRGKSEYEINRLLRLRENKAKLVELGESECNIIFNTFYLTYVFCKIIILI